MAGLDPSTEGPRGRDVKLAVAACALLHDAALWTLIPTEFSDVPGLGLV